MIHAQTAFLVIGLLYVILPLTTWTILYRRHNRRAVALWCAGNLLYGAGFLLVGMRGLAPLWLSLTLANPISFAGYIFRGAALQIELGRPVRAAGAAALWLGCSAAFIGAHALAGNDAPRMFVSFTAHFAGSLWLAWLAWQLYRQQYFRSAAALAGAFLAFAATLLVRDVILLGNWDGAKALTTSWDWTLSFLAGLVAVVYGNLAYVGIALERSQRQELARSGELIREHERHEHAQQRMREQGALLAEREALLASRDELMVSLAHEVRQPLNNASAALQSAGATMAAHGGTHTDTLQRLQRANTVLTQVASALDNTLSEAVLLSGKEPIARQEVDIDTLVEMAIADIDPHIRWRIRRMRSTPTRTASLHPALLRLALRNVLANALAYSPADADVVVNIADCDEPLALMIEVIDQGDGIAAELMPRLFERGARGAAHANPLGHGLGLYIVKRTMELHGGQVLMRPATPRGMSVVLLLPQGQAD